MTLNSDYLFKLFLLGDVGVGEKSLILRFVDGSFTEGHHGRDIDMKTKAIELDGKIVKLLLVSANFPSFLNYL